MKKATIRVLYDNGVSQTYLAKMKDSQELETLTDIVEGSYARSEGGYLRIPNVDSDSLTIIDLSKTTSMVIEQKGMFDDEE